MLFNSTYPDNVKRQTKKVELGRIRIDDYHENLIPGINRIVAKSKVPPEKIKFYKKTEEIDEYGHTEDYMIFFHEVPETDAEYAERIAVLEKKDIHKIVDCLAEFRQIVHAKKDVQTLVEKHYGKGKGKWKFPEWQQKLVDELFSTKSTQELVVDAVRKERREGEKQLKELRDKIKGI